MSHKTYVIAEIGANHMGDFVTAIRLIEEAKQAGADACKFQLFTPLGLVHPTHPAQETLERFALPRGWMPALVQVGRHIGIDVSATPCDLGAVDLLHSLNVPWIKIASGDLTYHKLIRHAAKTGRRLILSTGFATINDIEAAINATEFDGAPPELVLLQCVGAYPSEVEDANLRVINQLAHTYGCMGGLSDHTTDVILPALAVAAGAVVIEKHFRLEFTPVESPDYPHSLEPAEFAEMVKHIRMAESAMGTNEKRVLPCEEELRITARRGLYWAKDLSAGHVLQDGDVAVVRPAHRKWNNVEFAGIILKQALRDGAPGKVDRHVPLPSALQPADEERLLGCELLCDVVQWGVCGWETVKL